MNPEDRLKWIDTTSGWDIADYREPETATTASEVLAKQNEISDLAIAEAMKWSPFTLNHDPSLIGDMRSAFQEGFIRGYSICNSSSLQNEIDKLR